MQDENKQSPLYYAIKSNRTEVLRYLLERGCNLQIVDTKGHTPINVAMRNKNALIRELLIKYGSALPSE